MPVPEYLPEHEILNELQDKGVKGIPSVSCAWDVAPYGVCYDTIFADMFTQFNPGWWSTDEATIRRGRRALRVLRPYRLISPEVGVDLRTFKDWKQVLFVVDDTFRGTSNSSTNIIRLWRCLDSCALTSDGTILLHLP